MAGEENKVIKIEEKEVLPADISQRIQEAKRQNNALMTMMDELMQEGIDYGKVPGVPKPFLHQPGAQQLGLVFKFRPEFIKMDSVIDFNQDPVFLSYEYKCRLYHKESDVFLGEGVGSCNNYERKYKYYRDKTVFEDPLDRQNTIIKMAKKRAYVDATLNVTGASRLFTQDEDLVEHDLSAGNNNKSIDINDPGEYKMPFGKNKGVKLKNLDEGYLNWIVGQMQPKNEVGEKVQEMAEKYLNADKKSTPKIDNKKSAEGLKRITEMNELLKDDKELWSVVKEYLEEVTGEKNIKNLTKLSSEEFETIINTVESMIPAEDDFDDDLEEDFDVPF